MGPMLSLRPVAESRPAAVPCDVRVMSVLSELVVGEHWLAAFVGAVAVFWWEGSRIRYATATVSGRLSPAPSRPYRCPLVLWAWLACSLN